MLESVVKQKGKRGSEKMEYGEPKSQRERRGRGTHVDPFQFTSVFD